jgi:hypothetical protein
MLPNDLWSRKQNVGLAHQPIGHEADPLLCSPIELDQGCGPSGEPGEWARSAAGRKFHRIGLHLKSSNPKAGDRAAVVTNSNFSLGFGLSGAAE